MKGNRAELNRFLVEVFDEILKTEEESLAGSFSDLSLRELHLIEEVCRAEELKIEVCCQGARDNRATAIAAAQRVTAGTLSTAVSLLERKGYLERRRDERDRRAVRIWPTEKARAAAQVHAAFHREMVDEILKTLSDQEAQVLVRALGSLTAFFREKYEA